MSAADAMQIAFSLLGALVVVVWLRRRTPKPTMVGNTIVIPKGYLKDGMVIKVTFGSVAKTESGNWTIKNNDDETED